METATTTAESVAYTIDTCYSRTIGVQYLSMAKMVQYLVLAKIVQYLFLATMVVTDGALKPKQLVITKDTTIPLNPIYNRVFV